MFGFCSSDLNSLTALTFDLQVPMGCGSSNARHSATSPPFVIPVSPPQPPLQQPIHTPSKLTEDGHDSVIVKFYRMGDGSIAHLHEAYCHMANDYPNILFMEAEACENMEAVQELDIQALPSFIAFQRHSEIGRYEGSDVQNLRMFVAELATRPKPPGSQGVTHDAEFRPASMSPFQGNGSQMVPSQDPPGQGGLDFLSPGVTSNNAPEKNGQPLQDGLTNHNMRPPSAHGPSFSRARGSRLRGPRPGRGFPGPRSR